MFDEEKLVEDDWSRFRVKLRAEQTFRQMTGPGWDAERLERACRVCWNLLNDEMQRLQQNLREVSFRALKQAHVRAQDPSRDDPDFPVEFVEPLNHVDGLTRDLVLTIVGDKVQQILRGNPPQSLMRMLVEAGKVDTGGWKEQCEEAEKRARIAESNAKTLQDRVEGLQDQVSVLEKKVEAKQQMLDAALERERELQARVRDLTADLDLARKRIKKLENDVDKLEHKCRQLEEEIAQLKERIAELTRELEKVKEKLREAEEEIQRQKGVIEELEKVAREFQEKLKVAEEKLKKQEKVITELKQKISELDLECAKQKHRAAKAEKEAMEYKEELDRILSIKKRTLAVQTDMTCADFQEQMDKAEVSKTKLKEIRECLGVLEAELHKRGLADLLHVAGLRKNMPRVTLHERLHSEAAKREARLLSMQEHRRGELLDNFVTETDEDEFATDVEVTTDFEPVVAAPRLTIKTQSLSEAPTRETGVTSAEVSVIIAAPASGTSAEHDADGRLSQDTLAEGIEEQQPSSEQEQQVSAEAKAEGLEEEEQEQDDDEHQAKQVTARAAPADDCQSQAAQRPPPDGQTQASHRLPPLRSSRTRPPFAFSAPMHGTTVIRPPPPPASPRVMPRGPKAAAADFVVGDIRGRSANIIDLWPPGASRRGTDRFLSAAVVV